MRNINIRLCKKIFLALLVLPVLLIFIYDLALWTTLDFDPHFREIDSCLDRGGVWDDTNALCRTE